MLDKMTELCHSEIISHKQSNQPINQQYTKIIIILHVKLTD